MRRTLTVILTAAIAVCSGFNAEAKENFGKVIATYYPQDGKTFPGVDPIMGWTKSTDPGVMERELALATNCGIDSLSENVPSNAVVVTVNRKDRAQTPVTFEKTLRAAVRSANGRDIVIDGWNGYADGKWIIQDFNDAGELWLDAVAAVFGRKPKDRLVSHGSKWSSVKLFSLRAPDRADIAYGPHWKQRFNLWLPPKQSGTKPLPVLINCHGGGWTSGGMVEPGADGLVSRCDREGLAFVTLQYRFIQDASRDGVKPPVKACLEDCASLLRFLAAQAKEWNLDISRVGMTGGSAGGASILWAALSPECPPVAGVVAYSPQTSLDPKQVRSWLPAIEYGPHAFDCRTYTDYLAQRDALMPEINRWSAAQLVPVAKKAGRNPKIWVVNGTAIKEKETPFESIHSPVFCLKFKEICDADGMDCTFVGHGSKVSAMDELFALLHGGKTPQ